MGISDKWIGVIGQAIAALGIIASNNASIKAEVEPIKLEQAVAAEKLNHLSVKVDRLEKAIGN